MGAVGAYGAYCAKRESRMGRVSSAIVALALMVVALVAVPRAQVAAPPAAVPADLALDRPLPVDPAVRSGRLPNGIRYFIRQNSRPANRVSMRLAVNVGSLQEDPDQRGLAHFLEHMAFNGSENFKPGELVSFLETIGARFGPHVNASTSFDETIYMLDIPTDRPGYADRGMLVLHDFAAGMSLLPAEVEKERGVVLTSGLRRRRNSAPSPDGCRRRPATAPCGRCRADRPSP